MTRNILFAAVLSVPLLATACATTPAVRGGATGAAVGAAGGAVIGNNVGSGNTAAGAAIGAVGGAVVGAAIACQQQGGCSHNPNNPRHSQLYYDQHNNRYWYEDRQTGNTYWQNGEPRTRAPRR
ncbi:MAG TPA: hypothetical protein DF715_15370 [Oceanicaulis sp.]|jgi:uncharacterized protein YcfJ|uniref:Outer membrane protein n=1 Tax=Glycocaulis albus TaxID=1382801 RepID=A0ABQ1XK96_9PROT|nr:YMGG-like glycine zipper-containing protein [Glycocaulis albus]MBV5258507.1 hypothetical protein [Synechococcus moorigangaii CMS01]GGG95937.1 outer membrane protein [Glycocaulis albus]HCY56827.1 hypothetical protein [Oceanicaulis sp.]